MALPDLLGVFGDKNKEEAPSPVLESSRRRRRVIHSIEARLDAEMSPLEKLSDKLVSWFGSVWFLVLNAVFFAGWVLANAGYLGDIEPFDPYPFTFLTMVVSLEAIFLAIFVLISQNQEARVSKLREEVDIQVNMISEQEITKIIHLLAYIMKHLNVPVEKDAELKRMMQPLDTKEIEAELEKQLGLNNKK